MIYNVFYFYYSIFILRLSKAQFKQFFLKMNYTYNRTVKLY
ncbi:hypothetical protein BN1325_350017 [Staphylococcus aureus]|nr:hypothetical protein BN1323_160017 [Staphylococcus aureus]CRI20606.1 hypothetical protein SAET23_360017 [Staphylococcus aureus]CRI26367.1 hypothetical protein BN1325_350017 [Staphylococcus aureus]CRI27481.1 hypothetical protein SAET23_360017 [Staphylococcus aureus]CRI30977.1 hypothetical protein BN1325_350017 [Staphylococcus aureus]